MERWVDPEIGITGVVCITQLGLIGYGIYFHDVVNNNANFVHPVNIDIHIQSIEFFWNDRVDGHIRH